ncbi:DUF3331 domain-containing protein [Caballeronia insecticola]|uniref:Ribosomal protein S14 n=1 Tax=Caballeronia insecticola TaxID=758793 RepID=A0A060PRB7_9BURK|nr:DUF3331 domain-containing protein [Caballeronia insecticola]BAO94184.1 putative uncharacterized protein [Caballeronia insecticola]
MEAQFSAWEQTLKLLAQVSSSDFNGETSRDAGGCSAPHRVLDIPTLRTRERDTSPSALVSILERSSSKEVSLCWRDATLGRYGDQQWILQVSRRKTVCALTGASIQRGDRVYRPRLRGRNPRNATFSILAAAMEQLERGPIRAEVREDGVLAEATHSACIPEQA